VEAVLDAAVKLLKRAGSASLTTNRIAETAGVSIGPFTNTSRTNERSISPFMNVI
jgi:AcrR family transcriptional regulator